MLASASDDKTIKLWNVPDGEHIATLERHSGRINSVTFSSDGSAIISGSEDGTIGIWLVGQ